MRNSPRADRKSGGLSSSSAGGEPRKRSPAVRRRAALAGVNLSGVDFMYCSLSICACFNEVQSDQLEASTTAKPGVSFIKTNEGLKLHSRFDALNGDKLLFRTHLLATADPAARKRPGRSRLFPRADGQPGRSHLPESLPLRIALRPPELADIEDSDDEAAIARPFAAIGRDAHEMPDPVDCLDGLYDCLAARGHAR